MLNPNSQAFLDRIRERPNFDYGHELQKLVDRFGATPELVQGIVDEKILTKDDACRFWADTLNVA